MIRAYDDYGNIIEDYEKSIYNKAIDYFASMLTTRLTDAIHSKDIGSVRNLINEISEQLKKGAKNE